MTNNTTNADLIAWFKTCKADGDDYMLVFCDTYDYEDYPVGVRSQDYWTVREQLERAPMQLFMESYDLHADRTEQIALDRADRVPSPRPRKAGGA